MARTRHESNAETLDVVVRIAERMNLELAAVARARIDLADGERASKRPEDLLLQARDYDVLVRRRRRRLGPDPAFTICFST